MNWEGYEVDGQMDISEFLDDKGVSMRDILFKAKRIDNGEWVEGDLVRSYLKIGNACITDFAKGIVYGVDNDTICQYTGLTDKNGNKIWENDVLHLKTRPSVKTQTEFLTTVDWDNECAGFLMEDDEKGGAVGLDAIGKGGIYEIVENLGSIFDNAELLEG